MRLTGVMGLLAAALLLVALPACAGEQRPFVRGSFADIRAGHVGKPLIVHVWSLTCAPCLTELPVWGRIAARHPGVALVLIEADRPEPRPGRRARDRLVSAGLGSVESWAFADRFEDRLRFEIDPEWQGELPRTLLIGAGAAVTVIPGPADEAVIEAWIAQQAR